jgi:5-methylcytosine-specific restriction endonuclease McrA
MKKTYTEKERAQLLWKTYKNRIVGPNPFDELLGFTSFEQFVHSYYGEPCHYCGEILTVENISLEHKTPLKRGGTNHPGNLECITKICNRRKGEFTEKEYNELLSWTAQFPEMRAILLRRLSQAGFMFFRKK